MGWWGNNLNGNSFQPKLKNRFIVEMGNGGRLLSVSSVTKPTATVDSKAYKMINHTYNYPGTVKWEPIEIKFVDGNVWGTSNHSKNNIESMTSQVLWKMLIASGYTPPANFEGLGTITSPEKASMMDISFGESLKIHQLTPKGSIGRYAKISSNETWQIFNPIITKISWGDLSYGEDSLVEYTLSITYDYAIHNKNN